MVIPFPFGHQLHSSIFLNSFYELLLPIDMRLLWTWKGKKNKIFALQNERIE